MNRGEAAESGGAGEADAEEIHDEGGHAAPGEVGLDDASEIGDGGGIEAMAFPEFGDQPPVLFVNLD